jgi:hypothetical protein
MTGCPHADVRFCPLYHAAHMAEARGLSCDDGQLGGGECAASRSVSYARCVEHLKAKCPGLVEQLAWREEAERTTSQRKRNLNRNGIH